MLVEITNITGSEPYDIFVCDIIAQNCIWIDNITDSELPYSFLLPEIFSSYENNFTIKFVDSNLCQFTTQSVQVTPTQTPTNTITPTQTPTNTETPTLTPTNTLTPTITLSNSETPTQTPTQTFTPTNTLTVTPTPTSIFPKFLTQTPSQTATPTPTLTSTPTESETPTPTPSITSTNTLTPTVTPTFTPTPSITPTFVCECYTGVTVTYLCKTGICPGTVDIGYFTCYEESYEVTTVDVGDTVELKGCVEVPSIDAVSYIPNNAEWSYSLSGATRCCDK
jgi:hypothetical protein